MQKQATLVTLVVVSSLMINSILITYVLYKDLYQEELNQRSTTTHYVTYQKPKVVYDNISVRAHFCRVENCSSILLKYLNTSSSAYCLFYDISLRGVFDVFLNKNTHRDTIDNNIEKINFIIGIYSENWDKRKEELTNNKTREYSFLKVISSRVMHDKYCIINKTTVITGSFNPTSTDSNTNDNNLVIIKSSKLSEQYLIDFFRVTGNLTRNQTSRTTQRENYEIIDTSNNITLQACFTTDRKCKNLILKEILKANRTINFLTFSFTDEEIASALLRKHEQGVFVRGVVESKFYSRTPKTIRSFVVKDSNPRNMHHKFFVIDSETVITGSYNPTYNAEKNFENIIVIKNKRVAFDFTREFFRVFGKTKQSQK